MKEPQSEAPASPTSSTNSCCSHPITPQEQRQEWCEGPVSSSPSAAASSSHAVIPRTSGPQQMPDISGPECAQCDASTCSKLWCAERAKRKCLCKAVAYCSKVCQLAEWTAHSMHCFYNGQKRIGASPTASVCSHTVIPQEEGQLREWRGVAGGRATDQQRSEDGIGGASEPQAKGWHLNQATCEGLCMGWRQAGSCSEDGPREPWVVMNCSGIIDTGMSGYCECDGSGASDHFQSLPLTN